MEISNKVAIVTGGASGLGEATVRKLIKKNAKVGILDLSEGKGKELEDELGENVVFIKTNVTKENEVIIALNKITQLYGTASILVNCAGIGPAQKTYGSKGMHDLDVFKKVININLIGTFNVIRIVAEMMSNNVAEKDEERGVIINTASIAAFDGQVGQAAYSASKAGIVGLTLPIARDLATYGIRIMTIAPGLFETPLFETLSEENRASLGETVPFPKRLGKPMEYANLVQSIIENTMLNGETIRLDGAIRMKPK